MSLSGLRSKVESRFLEFLHLQQSDMQQQQQKSSFHHQYMKVVAVSCHHFFHMLQRLQCNIWSDITCLFKERNILIRNIFRPARESTKNEKQWKKYHFLVKPLQAFFFFTYKAAVKKSFPPHLQKLLQPWYQDIYKKLLINLESAGSNTCPTHFLEDFQIFEAPLLDPTTRNLTQKTRLRYFSLFLGQIFESWNTNLTQIWFKFAHVYEPLRYEIYVNLNAIFKIMAHFQ